MESRAKLFGHPIHQMRSARSKRAAARRSSRSPTSRIRTPSSAPRSASKTRDPGLHDSLLTELLHLGSDVRTCMVNLPAINTPQFRWIRNHMPRKPQPFGAVFEPEVAARAIVHASEHPRREVNVSWGTTLAIVANSFAPAALDHYLARIGTDAQQSDEPEEPGRADNLFATVTGDAGAHGVFSERAKSAVAPWRAIAVGVGALALIAIVGGRWDE